MTLFAPYTPGYLQVDDKKVNQNRQALLEDQKAWNKRREGAQDRVHLTSVDLSKRELIGINLRFADLRCANLRGANLSSADLYGADLRGADFRDSYGNETNFKESNLLEARFDNSSFNKADFQNTHLGDANFTCASLCNADFKGAFLHNAKFEAANLHGATDFVPSSTLIRDARFAITSTDLWSQLRRAYTGPRFALNLLFLLIFILPYIAKAIYWKGINQSQTFFLAMADSDGSSTAMPLYLCLANECSQTTVLSLVLGFDRPASFWILGLALLVYNLFRGGLTFLVAPLRDEEERTGYSPRFPRYYKPPFDAYDRVEVDSTYEKLSDFLTRLRESYSWMRIPHAVVRVLFYIAVISFIWHAIGWLRLPVYIPAS